MKRIILFASIVLASGTMMTNVYTSLVDVPAWSSNVPESIETARHYYSSSNPGNFFRIFSPLNQLLGLISLVLFWKSGKQIRLLVAAAFLCYIVAEGMTFMYFYPRNAILFTPGPPDTAYLTRILSEWAGMNWLRTAAVGLGIICAARAQHLSYETTVPSLTLRKTSRQKQVVQDMQ